MPFYNEYTQTFEFSNGAVDIICKSMGELVNACKELASVNILTILN